MRRNEIPERIERERNAEMSRTVVHIPFLAGRPIRDSSISSDDMVNLVIALYTTKSLEEFLNNT